MIRQAHTYLVGALSGVVVIGIAIAAFVVLVSAQVFHDLPIPALSGSDQKTAVSSAKAVSSPAGKVVATNGGSAATAQPDHAAANANANGGAPTGASNPQTANQHPTAGVTSAPSTNAPAELVETAPTAGTGNESSPSSGGNSGAHPTTTSSPPPSSSPSPSGGGNSGGPTTGAGNSGSGSSNKGSSAPTETTSPSTGGGGSTTTSPPSAPVTTGKVSEGLSESVNNAVGTVDEATGGTLGETGVTHVTEEAVEGAVGPESVVGKTVGGVEEVVGGLLGGNGH
jgi:hypothetical protein